MSFITNDEKQTLQVPARDQRVGYDVATLQKSLSRFDPATFRKFQQSHCHDPVALRVVKLHRLVAAEKDSPALKARMKAELEAHVADRGRTPTGDKVKPKDKTNERYDKKSSLPVKEGQPDKELYASFPPKSLRRRLWDAVVAGTCPRCSGPHLRVACPKPRQKWEDDFEKDGFFTKSPPPANAQLRVQLIGGSRNQHCPAILSVRCSVGRCLLDTCSDVSIARRDVLSRVRFVLDPVTVDHMGGMTELREAGVFELARRDGGTPITLRGVYVVEPETLPAGVVALLGVADIRALGISLDAVMAAPDSHWERAVRTPWYSRLIQSFRRCCSFWYRQERRGPIAELDRPDPFEGGPAPPPALQARWPVEERTAPFPNPMLAQVRRPFEGRPAPPRAPPRFASCGTPSSVHEGQALLRQTRRQVMDELELRTRGRLQELSSLAVERKLARSESSSASGGFRKRHKFYAVRAGRQTGIFHS